MSKVTFKRDGKMFRICNKCKQEKPLTSKHFHCDKSKSGGFIYKCKICRGNHRRSVYIKKPISEFPINITKKDGQLFQTCSTCKKEHPLTKDYFHALRSRPTYHFQRVCKLCNRKWRESEHGRNVCQAYRDNNSQYYKLYRVKYRKNNKPKIRKQQQRHYHNVQKYDPHFKILKGLRCRLNHTIKNRDKQHGSSRDLLGCSVEDLITHLESLWQEGMSWDNYGLYGWHIDHIIPCASFDLTDPEQQKKCFHYTNLQPLWAKDNLIKGDKLTEV